MAELARVVLARRKVYLDINGAREERGREAELPGALTSSLSLVLSLMSSRVHVWQANVTATRTRS